MSTHIQWTDETWNVVTGCDKVSPGCDNCYIERTIPFRMEGRKFDEHGKMGIRLHPDRLDKPLHWVKPRRVFVNSLSDLFHPDVPDEFIADVFDVMATHGRPALHTFQILTKRPRRMERLLNRWKDEEGYVGAPNVWLGVSVENQRYADMRIPYLLKTPAAVRFLSCEPLLGPVDLSEPTTTGPIMYPVDWVICGGESGPGARPMHPDWARSLRDQCIEANVPFFFKQFGEWGHQGFQDAEGNWRGSYCTEEPWHLIAHDGTVGPIPFGGWAMNTYSNMGWAPMGRLGVKKTGRELDGRTWDEFPDR